MGSDEMHCFAMVLDVKPAERAAEWARRVGGAKAEKGMSVEVRTPTLLMFAVEDQMEYLAIERAMRWLKSLADAPPSITLVMNAQPDHEV